MKIYIASLTTETNTFVSVPTGMNSFVVGRENYDVSDPCGNAPLMQELCRLAEQDGHTLIKGLLASAQPRGRTVKSVYESFRDEIIKGAREALPLDAVILPLHGAMVADGYDDCEGDLLSHLRQAIGPDVAIGLELDLHCHMTSLMVANADVIVSYKEYPHTDRIERLHELYQLTLATAAGEVRPVTGVFDCKMVGLWYTTCEPMHSFVRRMQEVEAQDGVLSVSFGHGFPWGDVADSGARIWVVTDNDPDQANALASMLGAELWLMREQTRSSGISIDESLDLALGEKEGPVVIADIADNPGGGGAGDSTFFLRRIHERGIGDVALGYLCDPGAVLICHEVGVGATFDLRIGGKVGPASGDPVDLRVTVVALSPNLIQTSVARSISLGAAAAVRTESGIEIVLVTVRSQVLGPDGFENMGVALESKKIVVVKSTQHFHSRFAPLAKKILYAATPGAMEMNFASIPYQVRDLNFWPRVADPYAEEQSGKPE